MTRNLSFKIIIILLLSIGFASNAKSQMSIGMQAPAIVLKGISGEIIQLSDFKGKIVLLDFWASWCGPCRNANKDLEKIYQTFKDQDFVILGISLDSKENSWISAIKKDKMTYPHVIDTENWNSKTVEAYGVEDLPASFLIDKNGEIIALNPTLDEISKVLKQ